MIIVPKTKKKEEQTKEMANSQV